MFVDAILSSSRTDGLKSSVRGMYRCACTGIGWERIGTIQMH